MDVVDVAKWNERISSFRDFAHSVGAEFRLRILENGKEVVEVWQYYRPQAKEK
jgi:hypothetical protein